MIGVALVGALNRPALADQMVFVGWSQQEAGSREVLERTFERFRQANPDVQAEFVGFPFGQTMQNLVLRRRTRQPTHVAQMADRWLPIFVASGGLIDANDVLGRAWLESQIDPAILEFGRVGGHQYGVPWTAGAIALVGNRRVLERAGITEPPRTMPDFLAALRRIKAAVPNSVPFGLSTRNRDLIALEAQIIFWQHGARFFDREGNVTIDTPQARAALQLLVDMVREGLIARGNDRFDTRRLFGQELVGFYFDPPIARAFARTHSGQGAAYDENVMVLPTPVVSPGEPPRSIQWVHFLVMFDQGSVNRTANGPAARFIRFMVADTRNQLDYFNETGLFPISREAFAQVSSDPYIRTFMEIATTALPDEPSQWPNAADLTTIIGEEIEAALIAGKAVDVAIQDMTRRLNTAMARVRRR